MLSLGGSTKSQQLLGVLRMAPALAWLAHEFPLFLWESLVPFSRMPLQFLESKKPLTRVCKRVPGVHGKRGLERGWQKRLAKGLAKGWRRGGKGLARG